MLCSGGGGGDVVVCVCRVGSRGVQCQGITTTQLALWCAPVRALQGKREGTPTPDDEQRMMQEMRAEGLMATPVGGATTAVAPPAAAGTPSMAGAGGPAPKEGPGTKRIRREVFLKAADGSWQVQGSALQHCLHVQFACYFSDVR